MVWQLPLSLSETLDYFRKYDYPLTTEELWYWQHGTTFSKQKVAKLYKPNGKDKLWKLRKQREKYSQTKSVKARQVGETLKKFPTIKAIFVTGALAMNNCPKNDDVDFMIVTSVNTLWITRFFVNIYLHTLRRFPKDKTAPNKICQNLWLDVKNLKLKTKNLYIAHEMMQAKILWDKSNIHQQFLKQNIWAKKYLPMAYPKRVTLGASADARGVTLFLWIVNFIFFILQWMYMRSKMTTERVGLGYAFFHPRSSLTP